MDSAARKPLLCRVAETAGVSSATVDRVLNERGNVSPKTAQKVINAARQIGLKRILPGSYHKGVRIEVLLIRPELPLIKRINQYFINIASTLDRSVIVNRTILKNDDPKKFARHLLSCKAQGIILYGREDEEVHDAIIDGHRIAACTRASWPRWLSSASVRPGRAAVSRGWSGPGDAVTRNCCK